MCVVDGRVNEAEEHTNKVEDRLEAEQLAQVKKWTSFDELEKVIRDLPEFADPIRNLNNHDFDIATDEVRKIALDLDLTSVCKAYEAELDEEEEDDVRAEDPAVDENQEGDQ